MLAPLIAAALGSTVPFSGPVDVCAGCRPDAAGAILCPPHAEAERAALELLENDIGDGNAKRAIAALQALAALTVSHENAPSERLAAALARGLAHEACGVRLHALALLSAGQHFAAASSALSDAVSAFSRESATLRKAYELELERYEKDLRSRKPWSELSQEERVEATNRSGHLAQLKNDAWFVYAEHAHFGLTLADVLAKRDDTGVDALIQLCDAIDGRHFGRLRQVSALLLQARQDAVKRAVEFLDAWQAECQDREKALANFEREYAKARKKIGNSHNAGSALLSEFAMLELMRTELQGCEESGRKLHDAFAAMVRERGLGDPPEWDGEPHASWMTWLRRHQNQLPRRLDPAPADD